MIPRQEAPSPTMLFVAGAFGLWVAIALIALWVWQ